MSDAIDDTGERLAFLLDLGLEIPEDMDVVEVFRYLDRFGYTFAQSYGEPGYTQPRNGIVFANWNDVPNGVQEWLAAHDYDDQWSDEWIVDDDGVKAYRIVPDGHGWTPAYIITDDGCVVGRDEVEPVDDET